MEQPKQRREISCSLCNRKGHNIRGCNVPTSRYMQTLDEYVKYLYYCLISYENNWEINHDTMQLYGNDESVPDAIQQTIDRFKQNKLNLGSALQQPYSYIENLDVMSYKGIRYFFDLYYYKTISKQNILQMIHCLFIQKADELLIHNYQVNNSIPYMVSSIKHFNAFQELKQSFQKLVDESSVFISGGLREIASIKIRENRLRFLRVYTNERLYEIDRRIHISTESMEKMAKKIEELVSQQEMVVRRLDNLKQEKEKYTSFLPFFKHLSKLIATIKIKEDSQDTGKDRVECPICYSTYDKENTISLSCGHQYCNHCLLTTLLNKYSTRTKTIECVCPLCREPILELNGKDDVIQNDLQHLIVRRYPHIREIGYVIA